MNVWRHKKRGSLVTVLSEGKIQTELPLKDLDEVVIYTHGDDKLWVRRKEEFYDGRFEEVKQP